MGVGGRTIRIPEAEAMFETIYAQYSRFDGPVATERTMFSSPQEAAVSIKQAARDAGADIVGICCIEPSDVYKGREVTQSHAIAVGMRMRYREFQEVPSERSALECIRVYLELGETVIQLARHIRSLGYACEIEHPLGDSNLLHIPIGIKAGFGELGRHGSIIHPTLGPLFRMGSVAVTMDLAIDQPVDAGIAAFCDICRSCRKYCPAGAIPDERETSAQPLPQGQAPYKVDTGRCFPYFAKHNYCSICLPVCLYNHKEWARDFEGFQTQKFPSVAMEPSPPPCDVIPEDRRHNYPRLNRG
ncbi:MAG: reductive dehalogenase domain-containing protein [Planctomycetota bacterium]